MNVVGVPSYFDHVAFKVIAYAAEIAVEFIFDRFMYQRLSVLCAEHDMQVIFYE
jgi:hypothetical protein